MQKWTHMRGMIMIELIIGKPDSGKSAFAEEKALEKKMIPGAGRLYYIATMQVIDEESEKRVIKHRKMREGKGFITIEKETDILNVLDEIDDPGNAIILLECISNLAGNEMHRSDHNAQCSNNGQKYDIVKIVSKVSDDIKRLSESVGNLIIVTNEFSFKDADDNIGYDEETKDYINIVSLVNERLKSFAEVVYEFA